MSFFFGQALNDAATDCVSEIPALHMLANTFVYFLPYVDKMPH